MEPSVVGRDWSPVTSNKARGYCCRTFCRPPSDIVAEAFSPAVFARTWRTTSRPPQNLGGKCSTRLIAKRVSTSTLGLTRAGL
jgi:hypothetical protein